MSRDEGGNWFTTMRGVLKGTLEGIVLAILSVCGPLLPDP
jgi:hypothetical protein